VYYLQQLLYEVPLEGYGGVFRWWWVCRRRVPDLRFLPRDSVPRIVDNVGAEAEWGGGGVLVPTIGPAGVGKSSFVRALVKRVVKGELRTNLEVLKLERLGP